ncbi:MAG: hypothetical protein ABEJ99_04605 [Candidatus Nanohaloarchaea archaeon]
MSVGDLLDSDRINDGVDHLLRERVQENEMLKNNAKRAANNFSYAYLYWAVDPGGSYDAAREGFRNVGDAVRGFLCLYE